MAVYAPTIVNGRAHYHDEGRGNVTPLAFDHKRKHKKQKRSRKPSAHNYDITQKLQIQPYTSRVDSLGSSDFRASRSTTGRGRPYSSVSPQRSYHNKKPLPFRNNRKLESAQQHGSSIAKHRLSTVRSPFIDRPAQARQTTISGPYHSSLGKQEARGHYGSRKALPSYPVLTRNYSNRTFSAVGKSEKSPHSIPPPPPPLGMPPQGFQSYRNNTSGHYTSVSKNSKQPLVSPLMDELKAEFKKQLVAGFEMEGLKREFMKNVRPLFTQKCGFYVSNCDPLEYSPLPYDPLDPPYDYHALWNEQDRVQYVP